MCILKILKQEPIDLRQDLFITESRAADRARWACRHAGTAPLTQRRIDLRDHAVIDEADGVEWTQPIADLTPRSHLFIHAGAHRLERHFLLQDLIEHTRG